MPEASENTTEERFVMGQITGELREEALGKLSEVIRAVVGGQVHPKILQALINGDELEVVRILTLSALAAKEKVIRGQFNELVNEVVVWELLEQIDGLDSSQRQKLQPFLAKLWAGEEKKSDVGYPEGFHIRTPEEQLQVWKERFPELDQSHVMAQADGELPEGAEGWAVVPKPGRIMEPGSAVYHQALDRMLAFIAEQRELKNWREDKLTPEHLQLVKRTMEVHGEMNELPGDFWVFPFQFGKRWAGKSVRRGRVLYAEPEFGLGPYESSALLVTHPDRITGPGQLYIDCPGCVYSLHADGRFDDCLRFSWNENYDCLCLNYSWVSSADSYFGSLSGFRPSRP